LWTKKKHPKTSGFINSFVAGGGIRVDIGNDAKDALTKLLFCYYVWDLSYPKQYQLLGFLQTNVFEDKENKFNKGNNKITELRTIFFCFNFSSYFCVNFPLIWHPEPLNRNESGRFGALKSDSTHHFFRNACTKSGSLRFSQFSGC
jgi:hypothetical protein